ncbi:MAG TPA: DUF4148 domain-containing protein [Paraburkholderia sp.]|jgi:hypothetical protein
MKSVSRLMLGLVAAGCAVVCASALASPVGSNGPKTRAEVRADWLEWRAAGYDPLDWVNYPENAQRAGAIVAERRAAAAAAGAQMPGQQ